MNNQEEDGRDSSMNSWFIGGAFFLTFYVLAPVPIRWFFEKNMLPESMVKAFHLGWAPLAHLYDQVPAVRHFYDVLFKMLP